MVKRIGGYRVYPFGGWQTSHLMLVYLALSTNGSVCCRDYARTETSLACIHGGRRTNTKLEPSRRPP